MQRLGVLPVVRPFANPICSYRVTAALSRGKSQRQHSLLPLTDVATSIQCLSEHLHCSAVDSWKTAFKWTATRERNGKIFGESDWQSYVTYQAVELSGVQETASSLLCNSTAIVHVPLYYRYWYSCSRLVDGALSVFIPFARLNGPDNAHAQIDYSCAPHTEFSHQSCWLQAKNK